MKRWAKITQFANVHENEDSNACASEPKAGPPEVRCWKAPQTRHPIHRTE